MEGDDNTITQSKQAVGGLPSYSTKSKLRIYFDLMYCLSFYIWLGVQARRINKSVMCINYKSVSRNSYVQYKEYGGQMLFLAAELLRRC